MPNGARKLKFLFRTWVAALAMLALGMTVCSGQQFSFSILTEGLGNLNVNCILQDHTGYLWVGTENGLYRYDGREFRQFGAAEGLHGQIIQSLFVEPRRHAVCGHIDWDLLRACRDGQFGADPPPRAHH